jgi:hypothetical protein
MVTGRQKHIGASAVSNRRELTAMKFTKKQFIAAGITAACVMGTGFAAVSPSHADPQQLNDVIAGVGSDTTQAFMDAMAGFNDGTNYTPINAGSANGYKQVISFDATVPTGKSNSCITTKLNGPAFTRPQGSGAGRLALYNASGSTYSVTSGTGSQGYTGTYTGNKYTGKVGTQGFAICAANQDLSGQVDFARSSSVFGGTSVGTGTEVTFVPFARDGLSYAVYRPGDKANAPTTLTRYQLIQMYNSTTADRSKATLSSGLIVIPCGINLLSGTKGDFQTKVLNGLSNTTEDAATNECNTKAATGATGRLEENDSSMLKAKGDALYASGTYAGNNNLVVVAGFASSAYIAKGNQLDKPYVDADVKLGGFSDTSATATADGINLGNPIASGTVAGKNLVANTTWYKNSTMGRTVFNAFPTDSVAGDPSTIALFVGTTSALCAQEATMTSFGFLPLTNADFSALSDYNKCGNITLYKRSHQVGDGI